MESTLSFRSGAVSPWRAPHLSDRVMVIWTEMQLQYRNEKRLIAAVW